MKILANENFPLKSIHYIRSKGYDVLSIGTDFGGIKDQEVLQLAMEQSRTILTFDRDYGELIFKHRLRPPNGVVYFRLPEFVPEEPGKIMVDVLEKNDIRFDYALTVIEKQLIRQRKY